MPRGKRRRLARERAAAQEVRVEQDQGVEPLEAEGVELAGDAAPAAGAEFEDWPAASGELVPEVAAPVARVTVELDEAALREAVAEYLESRLLRGGDVESVEFNGRTCRATVALVAVGPRAVEREEGSVGDFMVDGTIDLPDLVAERAERRAAAHERLLAKRGGGGRLQS